MFEHFYNKNVDATVEELMSAWIGQPNLSFLEIGSGEGSSAIGIIKTVLTEPSSKVTCVDKWDAAFSNGFFADDFELNFDSNTQPYASQIIKVKGDSATWLVNNQDKSFDFIYIDGDHTYSGCKMDSTLAWNTLKSGCWMVIDDYGFDGVTQATDEFTISAQGIDQMVRTETQTWFKKA
jgi:predicted O-methyltransferase YrrM